jgi:activator of HSP90 ATPase
MAKVGETDPRWIVAERADGTNVNNWHWTEKNCMPWAKERMPEIFEGTKLLENGEDLVKITKVDTMNGECHINTRKGKIFHFFEFEIKLKWTGTIKGDKVEGNIDMPEISFENDVDEHEIRVNVTKAEDKYTVRQLVSNQGIPKVRKLLETLIEEFRGMRGYLQEVKEVKPLTQTSADSPKPAPAVHAVPSTPATTASTTTSSSSSSSTSVTKTTKVEFNDKFGARPSDIYEALMDSRRVEAYTQSSAQLETKEGGKFSLFGGNVTGEFVQLVPNERIVQKWRTSTWPEGHHSTVTIELSEGRKGCDMKLTQVGVPEAEAERTQQAWRENIFERLKRMFGYGMGYSPF